MKNLKNGKEFLIDLQKKIIREIPNGEEEFITEIRMDQIIDLLNYKKLQESEKEEYKKYIERLKNNIVSGAIIGGLIDASEGEDSILDGILLGATFGALATGREEPKALIGLLLSDGSVIPFEVNKEEFSILKSVAVENQTKGITPSTPIRKRPLTKEEKERMKRLTRDLILGGIGIFIIFLFMVNQPFFLSQHISNDLYLSWKSSEDFLKSVIPVILISLSLIVIIMMAIIKKQAKRDNKNT